MKRVPFLGGRLLEEDESFTISFETWRIESLESWEFESSNICECGNLRIWKFRNLGIRIFRNLEVRMLGSLETCEFLNFLEIGKFESSS